MDVMEIVKVFNVADSVTGKILDEAVDATVSVTSVMSAPDFVGVRISPVLLSEIGAASAE